MTNLNTLKPLKPLRVFKLLLKVLNIHKISLNGEYKKMSNVYIVTSQTNFGDGWYEAPKAFSSRDKAWKEARRQIKEMASQNPDCNYDFENLLCNDCTWEITRTTVR